MLRVAIAISGLQIWRISTINTNYIFWWCRLFHDLSPFSVKINFPVFQGPHTFSELSCVLYRSCMVPIYINAVSQNRGWIGDLCVTNDIECVTVFIHRARIFISATASAFCSMGGFWGFVDFSLVVVRNAGFNVAHAAKNFLLYEYLYIYIYIV